MPLILVADDHPLNRHFLATLLGYHGHQVNEAADGVEALESAREHRPDVIIADVAMPRMNGFALVQELRSDPKLAGIPVIFYTASYRETESRAIAQAAGIEHLISKPSDPEVILQTVQKVLGMPAPPTKAGKRRAPSDPLRNYAERLQMASIRMSALIEASLELHAERDPDRLMRTASLAMQTIFACDFTVIAVRDEEGRVQSWIDGAVDQAHIEELLQRAAQPFVGRSVRNASGVSDPFVQPISDAMPGVRSILLLPMDSGRAIYGWILLGRSDTGARFSIDDERLALAAAGEIRAAHENLVLYRAQRQETAAMSREHDDLESRIDQRTSELGLADQALRGEIAERERVEEELRALFEASPVSIVAFDQNRMTRAWNPAAERIFGWRAEEVIGQKNPTIPPELAAAYENLVDQCLKGRVLTDIELQRMRKDGSRIDASLSMAPLQDPRGVVRGYVSIVNNITDRKHAEAELRSSRERLRALSARVLSIQEEERTRIARELHDDLGQLLTAIKIDVSRLLQDISKKEAPPARVLEGILPLIDSTLDTTGRIVSELRPTRIGEIGLTAAIEKKLADFQQRTEIECELSIRPEQIHVRDELATAVFRILEEALTNIARHSEATHAEVRLRQQGAELLLEVRDNGRGIRDEELLAENAYGLIGMRERAYLLGGCVTVTGIEGRGTIVTARIPLEGRASGGIESPK